MDKDEKSLESRANAKSGIYILLIAYFYSIIRSNGQKVGCFRDGPL